MKTYVENVMGRERIAPLGPPPRLRFVRNAKGQYRGALHKVNGQDVGTDGRNSDGRTPGDPPLPRVVGSVSAAGGAGMDDSGNTWLDSGSSDGTTPGDPHVALGTVRDPQNTRQSRTVECPECGYTFTHFVDAPVHNVRPLGVLTMNFAVKKGAVRGRVAGGNLYPDSGHQRDADFSDSGDDGNAGGGARLTDRVSPVDCPRCGNSFYPGNDTAMY
ncbi:MAG: hypothetical protein ABSB42_02510 [Tepidisphaeraceae bacterium]|jgi:predicted RNA-binding Zn-ribbon protein involved in translation (DUF1610 family)